MKNILKRYLAKIVGLPPVRGGLRYLSRRGLIPRAAWIRLPVDGTFFVSPVSDCGFLYRFVPEDLVGNNLFWKGSFEAGTASVFVKLVKGARLFVDVGANTGFYTLLALAANPTTKVIAFEPVPRVRHALETNIAANGWQSRCQILPLAVTDHMGEADFSVLRGGIPASSSLKPEGFRGKQVSELIRVQTTTFDNAVVGQNSVDLVKIDVEGFEDSVLKGMTHTLTNLRPTLIVECNHDGPYEAVELLIRGAGYKYFYRLTNDSFKRVERIAPAQGKDDRNYLCAYQPLWETHQPK